MRQIDWTKPLTGDDVTWLRNSGQLFVAGVPLETKIAQNAKEHDGEVETPEETPDPTTRSVLDPTASLAPPMAALSAEEQRDRLGGSLEEEDDEDEDDYDEWTRDDLQTEVDRRKLDVEGTGKNGSLLKADMIKALRADDAESE